MNNIYNLKELSKPTFFQKLLKKNPPQNFVLEVNNLLAKTQLMKLTLQDVSEIAIKYGGKVLKKSNTGLNGLYAEYLKHCLTDKVFSENELKELKHLKDILSLTDSEINQLHTEIVGAVYHKNINEIIIDGKIDTSEKDFLTKLQNDLKLSDEVAHTISAQVREQFVKDFFSNMISDERLSPEEEKQFELLSKNLYTSPQIDAKSKSVLDRYKLYWVIENGEIPEINVELSLAKNEKCYFQSDCEWYEMRTVTQSVNYRGPTASIKIMKGVRYRVGSIKPQRITSEEWKKIGFGTLYLTNKRIILMGQSKNLSIKLEKVLSFTPYSDGAEISKDTGRSPLIIFPNNADIFSLILSRLLNE